MKCTHRRLIGSCGVLALVAWGGGGCAAEGSGEDVASLAHASSSDVVCEPGITGGPSGLPDERGDDAQQGWRPDGCKPAEPPPEGGIQGYYLEAQAHLASMNTAGLCGAMQATAEAYFVITGGRFMARITGSGVAPVVVHPILVYEGGACPPADADTNGDGFIDHVEAGPYYGEAILGLDDDLIDSGLRAETYTSTKDPEGRFEYFQAVPLRELLDGLDLRFPQELALAERVVVIHGVAASALLPDSVASPAGIPSHRTLPVACGRLVDMAPQPEEPEEPAEPAKNPMLDVSQPDVLPPQASDIRLTPRASDSKAHLPEQEGQGKAEAKASPRDARRHVQLGR